MARKAALRLAAEPSAQVANDAPETAAAANLAQGELRLATAALLPALDAAGAGGHAPSRLAASLLRAISAPNASTPPVATPTEAEMAAAAARLARLAREQETHIARLQSMLEALL